MSVELAVDHVEKRFGGIVAVDDVSLTVRRGSITGLIGPNGAGKSTLFNLITGVYPPTSGDIVVDGTNVTGSPGTAIAQMGIGRTFQTPRGFASLSVLENVEVMLDDPRDGFFNALLRRDRRVVERRDRARAALARVALEDRAGDAYGNLSSGEQRLLEIARQLVREPRALLLDEPTAGVHPSLQDRLAQVLRDLNESGVTVLVVEHNIGFLMALATDLHVMARGALIASGDPQEVSRDQAVIDAYLGTGGERRHAPSRG